MNEEQVQALEQARGWCEVHLAVVRWDEAETRCRIGVPRPHGEGFIESEGAGYYEAYVEVRVRFEAAATQGGPPSWF